MGDKGPDTRDHAAPPLLQFLLESAPPLPVRGGVPRDDQQGEYAKFSSPAPPVGTADVADLGRRRALLPFLRGLCTSWSAPVMRSSGWSVRRGVQCAQGDETENACPVFKASGCGGRERIIRSPE